MLVEWFIPAHNQADPKLFYRSRMTVVFTLVIACWAPVFALTSAAKGAPLAMVLSAPIGAAVALLGLLVLRRTGSYVLAANILMMALVASSFVGVLFTGGIRSDLFLLTCAFPIAATYLAGIKSGVLWTLVLNLQFPLVFLLEKHGFPLLNAPVTSGWIPPRPFLFFNAVTTTMLLTAIYERTRDRLSALLVEQQGNMLGSARMAALGEMSAGVAHEINTPLTVIHLKAEQLERMMGEGALDTQEIAKALELIKATTGRIAKITRGLLAFSRDLSKTPMTPASVRTIVSDTVALCGERFKAAGISLRLGEIPEDLFIPCHSNEISQALFNLLINAYAAVKGATDAKDSWVALEARATATFVEFSVVDSGPGIPEQIWDRIFEPFFTTRELGMGSGLGLSVSRGIVQAHGGSLTLKKDAPHTTFSLIVPRFRG